MNAPAILVFPGAQLHLMPKLLLLLKLLYANENVKLLNNFVVGVFTPYISISSL